MKNYFLEKVVNDDCVPDSEVNGCSFLASYYEFCLHQHFLVLQEIVISVLFVLQTFLQQQTVCHLIVNFPPQSETKCMC